MSIDSLRDYGMLDGENLATLWRAYDIQTQAANDASDAARRWVAANAEYADLLRELLVQLCENPGIREDGNAPGHAHEVPGVWDGDNDELAGKPCAWCAVWARAVANWLVGSNVLADRREPHSGEASSPKGDGRAAG